MESYAGLVQGQVDDEANLLYIVGELMTGERRSITVVLLYIALEEYYTDAAIR